jgi:glycosyltransferase involved in cell wall biosynthesis
MIIGIAGPANIQALFNNTINQNRLPKGLGGTVLQPLIFEYMAKGHEVIFFTFDQDIKETLFFYQEKLKVCVIPYRKKHRARDFFKDEIFFLEKALLQEKKLGFIHAHWTYEFALAALKTGIPTLVTAHDAPLRILQYDPTPYRFIRTLMALECIKRTLYMSHVSPYIERHFQKSLGYKKFSAVVPNGLADEQFSYPEVKKKARGKTVVFSSVANGWSNLKNTSTLLKSFALVREKINAELWLLGNGHGPDEAASSWARKHNITHNVYFLGFKSNQELRTNYLNKTDILVHPSLNESFSLAIAEALAMGIPVIGGENSGGVPFVLDYGKAGVLSEVHSVQKLANTMLWLAEDELKQQQIGLAGYKYVNKNFRIETVANQYQNLYQRLQH